MDDDYERILLIKPECFVYKLPPRPSSTRGYRAADWGLDKPQWTGRMRITATSKKVVVKLEDSSGQLFAAAPIDTYPGVAVESVTDSSRYFVLRVADGSGRTAFIGIGFGDRGDAFDFNVALQDHFNREKITEKLDAETAQPNLNLGLKEGQTLTIKIGNSQANKSRPKQKTSAVPSMGISLPPPPGSTVSSRECPPQPQHIPAASIAIPPQQQASTTMSDWGEFTAAAPVAPSSTSQQWVQF